MTHLQLCNTRVKLKRFKNDLVATNSFKTGCLHSNGFRTPVDRNKFPVPIKLLKGSIFDCYFSKEQMRTLCIATPAIAQCILNQEISLIDICLLSSQGN